MNPEAEKVLKEILNKSIPELTQTDIDFLRARKAYVGKNSRIKFASIFEDKPQQEVKPKTEAAQPQEKEKKDRPQEPQAQQNTQNVSQPKTIANDDDDDDDETNAGTGIIDTDDDE
jgi:hypothetical protein